MQNKDEKTGALWIADPLRQTIRLRRPNPGKRISDNLPALEIAPEALDAYSEMDPLHELPGAIRNKAALVTLLEMQK